MVTGHSYLLPLSYVFARREARFRHNLRYCHAGDSANPGAAGQTLDQACVTGSDGDFQAGSAAEELRAHGVLFLPGRD